MRPVRIVATAVVAAALTVTGCSSGTDDQAATPAASAPTTQPTPAATTAGAAGTTTTTPVSPAEATCAISPKEGLAGSPVALSCRGLAPSEPVDVTFGATVLATTTATSGGQVAARFTVPSGFAGANYPGRKDTFQVKGRQSGTVASATFTVTG